MNRSKSPVFRLFLFGVFLNLPLCVSSDLHAQAPKISEIPSEQRWVIQVYLNDSEESVRNKVFNDFNSELDLLDLTNEWRVQLDDIIANRQDAKRCDQDCTLQFIKSEEFYGVIYVSRIHKGLGGGYNVELFNNKGAWIGQESWSPKAHLTINFEKYFSSLPKQEVVTKLYELNIESSKRLKSIIINDKPVSKTPLQGQIEYSYKYKLAPGDFKVVIKFDRSTIVREFSIDPDHPRYDVFIRETSKREKVKRCKRGQVCDGQIFILTDLENSPISIEGKVAANTDQNGQALITLKQGYHLIGFETDRLAYFVGMNVKPDTLSRDLAESPVYLKDRDLAVTLSSTTKGSTSSLNGVPFRSETKTDLGSHLLTVKKEGCKTYHKSIFVNETGYEGSIELECNSTKKKNVKSNTINVLCHPKESKLLINNKLSAASKVSRYFIQGDTVKCEWGDRLAERRLPALSAINFNRELSLYLTPESIDQEIAANLNASRLMRIGKWSSLAVSVLSASASLYFANATEYYMDERDKNETRWRTNYVPQNQVESLRKLIAKDDRLAKQSNDTFIGLASLSVTTALVSTVLWFIDIPPLAFSANQN